MRILLIVLLISFVAHTTKAQDQVEKDTIEVDYVRMEGDRYFRTSIPLSEVYVFGPMHFKNSKEVLRYLILKRRTIKVYPYAKLAADKLTELNDSLAQMKRPRKRRKYTKEMQQYIEGEFSDELKKLTRSEGQILIKLVYRQTGESTYGLVKELRSGWRAFWYSTTARMFNLSMKEEFHPDRVEEDYLIEDILQRAFADRILEYQAAALNYDYALLNNKWNSPKKEEK